MKKDINLSMKGLQTGEKEEQSSVETKTTATYYKKNKSHYVLYEEAEEGTSIISKNRMRFREHILELHKEGSQNVHMVFEENEKHLANYITPFGSILVGIDTKKLTVTETEQRIHIDIQYVLEMNEEFLSNCILNIELTE